MTFVKILNTLTINILTILQISMKKLTLKQKHWLLSAHIIFAALWTGTVLSMFLLSWKNRNSTNSEMLYTLHSAVKRYQLALVIYDVQQEVIVQWL